MEEKSFFGKLFDFSFEEFVTPTIIRIVYAIALIAFLATRDIGSILFGLIVVPLLYLLYLILTRIWMEIVVVIFRIAEPIRDADETLKRIEQLLAQQGGGPAPGATWPDTPGG